MFFCQPTFRWFQCTQEDNLDKSFTCTGNYIQQSEPNNKITLNNDDDLQFNFFDRSYDESIWFSEQDFRILCLLASKGASQLEHGAIQADTSYPKTDYSSIRRQICELCLASRDFITIPDDGLELLYLNNFRPEKDDNNIKCNIISSVKIILQNMKRLKELPDYVIFNSTKQSENINLHASYNLLHLSLDMFWLSLTFEHDIEEEFSVQLEVFENNLNAILSDLIYVSLRKFEKINNFTNLSKQSPFLCSCFKELWLLIQLFVEKKRSQHFSKDFWHYFNIAIKAEMDLQNCTSAKDAIACMWLVYHIAKIQGLNSDGFYIGPQHFRVVSNFPLIEQSLKIVTNKNTYIDEQLICCCLNLLANLQINWWKRDATFDLLQLLWEYFYKRLNTPFSNSSEGTFINNSQKYDYSSLTETILEYDIEAMSVSSSSYDIFLSLLGKYLALNPAHWPKLKGRIYSKLPATKLAAFTDIGLHNLIQLFFVLAYSVNFKELTDKLQSLLSQLPVAKSEGSITIWSAHISLLIMRVNKGISFNNLGGTEMCAPILLSVQSASSDRSQSHLMRTYIEGLKKIIECDKDLKCQEHCLFGGWINRYLQWCSHTDACFLLNILKSLIEKIQNLGGQEWWTVYEVNVVPSLIHLSSILDAPSQVAELAATLISADAKRFKTLLEHFTGDTVSISLSVKFLTALLDRNTCLNLISEHQTLLIQSWIRIAVLNTDKTDLSDLTSLISRLPNWSSLYPGALPNDEDPLYAVISTAGLKMRGTKSVQDTAALKKWFEIYFGRMDKWVGPVISSADKGENAQLVMRVYTAAAVLYLNCSPALYVKNKNTCILYRLTSNLLLPASVLMNKRPSNVILAALKRTWHLFVRGIARLDYKSDPYIQRTLKEMTVRYVPHMNDASSPIIRCLDNEFEDNACIFILDKIANNIITCKSKNVHEHSLPALKLILEMSKKCDNISKLEILSRNIFPSLFEQLIFSEDATAKNVAAQIIESIKTNQNYSQIKEIFQNSILGIIDKHLAFYSTNVFRFLENLVIILPQEIEDIFLNLTEGVRKVECMRGVGYDKTLRKGLQRIQELINNR